MSGTGQPQRLGALSAPDVEHPRAHQTPLCEDFRQLGGQDVLTDDIPESPQAPNPLVYTPEKNSAGTAVVLHHRLPSRSPIQHWGVVLNQVNNPAK
ncbi:MAG: hypothetical protein WCC38_12605 [Pseudonocardiaceae bacterium]